MVESAVGGTCCGCGVAGVGARAPLADDEGGARGDQKAVTPLVQLGEVVREVTVVAPVWDISEGTTRFDWQE